MEYFVSTNNVRLLRVLRQPFFMGISNDGRGYSSVIAKRNDEAICANPLNLRHLRAKTSIKTFNKN